MSLKLSNIFEIIYRTNLDEKSISNIKEQIDNLEIDNLLNINKKRLKNIF